MLLGTLIYSFRLQGYELWHVLGHFVRHMNTQIKFSPRRQHRSFENKYLVVASLDCCRGILESDLWVRNQTYCSHACWESNCCLGVGVVEDLLLFIHFSLAQYIHTHFFFLHFSFIFYTFSPLSPLIFSGLVTTHTAAMLLSICEATYTCNLCPNLHILFILFRLQSHLEVFLLY